ncbi:MAG: hypothetical protein AAF802_17020 [Planctomycetota bacterium]
MIAVTFYLSTRRVAACGLWVFIAVALLGRPACAFGPDEDQQDAKTSFAKALDEVEAEIEVREREAEYGSDTVNEYATELELEYRDLSSRLRDVEQKPSANRRLIESTRKRQKHISLLLWQLRRTGATLGQPNSRSNSEVHLKLHRLLGEHREEARDANLMKRFQELSRRTSELLRRNAEARMTGSFHFVRPEDNESFAIANGQQPLEAIRSSLGDLVQLRWRGGKLDLDEQHWEVPFAGKSLEEIEREVIEELRSRGAKIPEPDRTTAFRRKQLFETPPALLLFQDLQHRVSDSKRVHRVQGNVGQTKKASFNTGSLSASIRVSEEELELIFREETGSRRTLEFRRAGGDLSIRLLW